MGAIAVKIATLSHGLVALLLIDLLESFVYIHNINHYDFDG
jgi:hypothetical protein